MSSLQFNLYKYSSPAVPKHDASSKLEIMFIEFLDDFTVNKYNSVMFEVILCLRQQYQILSS